MKPITTALLAFALAFGSPAAAHDAEKGPKGGELKDAGNYHMELLAKENELTLYLYDGNEKPVPAQGAKATATVVAEKVRATVEFAAMEGNMMRGSGQFPATKALRVVVSLTMPGKSPVQARFAPVK